MDEGPGLSASQTCSVLGLSGQQMEQRDLCAYIATLEVQLASQQCLVEQLLRERLVLEKLTGTDPLTGLGNRRAFHQRLCQDLGDAAHTGNSLALVMLDVDFFKSYNDCYGHPAGDVVLKRLAELVLRSCRAADFSVRMGGEEFAVLLPGTTPEGAFTFSNWLRRRVERQVWPYRQVTISAGVAVAAAGESGLQLAARADAALYHSKRAGRNRVTRWQNGDRLSTSQAG